MDTTKKAKFGLEHTLKSVQKVLEVYMSKDLLAGTVPQEALVKLQNDIYEFTHKHLKSE